MVGTAQPLGRTSLMSPLGLLTVEATGEAIRALRFGPPHESEERVGGGAAPLLAEALAQLSAYFDGRLHRFRLPLRPCGTPFQRMVWGLIADIPHGATLRYGELAALAGSGPRAVARACAANPLPLLIPCHRVVGATAGAGGHGAPGGLATKRFLLELEALPLPLFR